MCKQYEHNGMGGKVCERMLVFIIVLIRKQSSGKAEVVILDHGLYQPLPTSVRQPLCRLWKAIVVGDHRQMKDNSAQLGVTGKD